MEVGADLEAARFEERQHLFPGRPRVGGRLEHDEVARAQALGDLLHRAEHDGEVGLAVDRERRRQRDEDGVGVP